MTKVIDTETLDYFFEQLKNYTATSSNNGMMSYDDYNKLSVLQEALVALTLRVNNLETWKANALNGETPIAVESED